jgi:hypothetical protein
MLLRVSEMIVQKCTARFCGFLLPQQVFMFCGFLLPHHVFIFCGFLLPHHVFVFYVLLTYRTKIIPVYRSRGYFLIKDALWSAQYFFSLRFLFSDGGACGGAVG